LRIRNEAHGLGKNFESIKCGPKDLENISKWDTWLERL
jgi:hypothetical protein